MPDSIIHPDGVYIGLSHAEHIADTAIGSSDLKKLVLSPPDWWWTSDLNTLVDRTEAKSDEEEKDHFNLGTAVHMALLEGLARYEEAYDFMPSRRTHPHALATLDQLKEACGNRMLPKSGNKPDLISRLLGANPEIEILEEIQRKWLTLGKLPVTDNQDTIVRLLNRMAIPTPEEDARRAAAVGPDYISLRKAFEGGISEVSVFWTDDDGIRQRARFDKLKPNTTIDLKTIGRWTHGNFHKSLLYEIMQRGYNGQAAHYDEGRHQARRLIAEGRVFGNVTDQQVQVLDDVADAEKWAFTFVFAKTLGCPQIKAIRMDQGVIAYEMGQGMRREALGNYLLYKQMFGLESMWVDPVTVWEPEHNDWPIMVEPR